jgi:BolA protein
MHSRGLETHYKAVVVGEAFAGKRGVQRHQLVYRALGPADARRSTRWRCTPTRRRNGPLTGAAPDSPACRGGSTHDRAARGAGSRRRQSNRPPPSPQHAPVEREAGAMKGDSAFAVCDHRLDGWMTGGGAQRFDAAPSP